MPHIVHARLDARTEKILLDLERRTGWSDSRLVREGIKALAGSLPPKRARRIIGLGRFRSGKADLGSSKAHLRGFGR